MPRPEDCLFTRDHEWIHVEGSVATVGITDFAQQELGDIVFVDMGEAGRSVSQGDEVGTIESVKAVAEVYAPASGEVLELNEGLADAPEKVNSEPQEGGWLLRLRLSDDGQLSSLMKHGDYLKCLEEEGH